jgi:hypothetical protein
MNTRNKYGTAKIENITNDKHVKSGPDEDLILSSIDRIESMPLLGIDATPMSLLCFRNTEMKTLLEVYPDARWIGFGQYGNYKKVRGILIHPTSDRSNALIINDKLLCIRYRLSRYSLNLDTHKITALQYENILSRISEQLEYASDVPQFLDNVLIGNTYKISCINENVYMWLVDVVNFTGVIESKVEHIIRAANYGDACNLINLLNKQQYHAKHK